MKPAYEYIEFGRRRIAFAITRSNRRKTVAISVRPDQTVVVAAPKGVRRSRVADVVRRKAPWILTCQERNGRCYPRQSKSLVNGESLRYLGRQYGLQITQNARRRPAVSVSLRNGRFRVDVIVTVPRNQLRRHLRRALVAWYRCRGWPKLHVLTKTLGPKLGVRWTSLEVREMPTRWGSAGSDGTLRFNWRIMMAPMRLVEYVVAHELCHLKHPNHSRAFWRMLGRAVPDYDARKNELARMGPLLDF